MMITFSVKHCEYVDSFAWSVMLDQSKDELVVYTLMHFKAVFVVLLDQLIHMSTDYNLYIRKISHFSNFWQ